MAARAQAGVSATKPDRDARRRVEILRQEGRTTFSSRDVMRLDRAGLGASADRNPILVKLEKGDCIRAVMPPANAKVGRPSRTFIVNPAVFGSKPEARPENSKKR